MLAGSPVPLHGRKARREALFTSPSGGGRTPPAPATSGARRRVVGPVDIGPRNNGDPSENFGTFRCRREHSDPEGHGCYCAPARGAHPGAKPSSKRSPPRWGNAKGRTFSGSGSARQGRQNLLISAALQTVPPDDESESNLRVKRSDPSFRANVPPPAAAVPEDNGSDAERFIRRRVWTQLGERAAGRRPPNPAERPHSIIPHGQPSERPCYEADNFACREE